MLRLIGIFLVIAGCSGMGLKFKSELGSGLWNMRYLRQLLEMMISEIRYNKSTLPECCRQVGKKMEEPYASTLQNIYELLQEYNGLSFAECWEQEMAKCLVRVPISKKERELVLGFASCGGLTENNMQIRAIEQYRDMIDSAIKKREESLSEQGRMATGLGIMSGLLLIIILL